MKHKEAGIKAGLMMYRDGETVINAEIVNENNGKSKIISFLIDTGFNGYLQLSELDVVELGLQLKNKSSSKIANGATVETGITTSKVKILEQEMVNFPIQFISGGIALIGTQLLRDAQVMLIFDYALDGRYAPTITKDKKLKAEIQSSVDKLGSI